MNDSMPMAQNTFADRTVFYKWSQIVEYLEKRFGKVCIAAWAEDVVVTEFSEDVLKIEAGSIFKCEIMRRRCLDHIQNALKGLFNSHAIVEIYAKES